MGENMGLFNTTSFRILEQGLNFSAENKKIIAHNIANIDTPGYKSKYLTFSGVLREKMNPNAKFKKELHLRINDVYVDEITNGQPDENNVDYEVQAAMLKSNALWQDAIMTHLEGSMSSMRTAMRRN
ncbi:MAG: flagellar basal body rod protein FlgB [Oscillospiraceae bacterium]|nr:flagellar basal body rod protein FlgB [Oscillospiraceae bacterium]